MKNLIQNIQNQFQKMTQTGILFKSSESGMVISNMYLANLDNDPIFRDPESTSHNCKNCKNFIRRYGNIIALDENNEIMSIWDDIKNVEGYESLIIISEKLKESPIANVFVETYEFLNCKTNYEKTNKSQELYQLGVPSNVKVYTKEEADKFGVVKPKQIITFDHLNLQIPKQYISFSSNSSESIQAAHKSNYDVFERGMREISLNTLELVKDLIVQSSLLNGDTHLHKIDTMISLKREYDDLPRNQRENWCWIKSNNFPLAKFRNELIGVLCVELTEGEDINKAVTNWNKRVDPINYMKAKAPITKGQIEMVERFVIDNGYAESFNRRFATIDDIRVSDILHSNIGKNEIPSISIFANVKPTKSSQHKRNKFEGVEEVHIDKFMKNILPTVSSVELYLENRMRGNLVSLTTASNPDSKPIFNWNNNFSWTFEGNLAGKSQIKNAVVSQGGKVEGVMRFSILWADGNDDDSDLDAHAIEPSGNTIYFSNKLSKITGGNLDIDITRPQSHKRMGNDVVENIIYPDSKKLEKGDYRFKVHQFSERKSKGFKAEIEISGTIYQYQYDKNIHQSRTIRVATVNWDGNEFRITHHLPLAAESPRNMYGLDTLQFHKVNLISLSPNHWGDNNVGNKHYFFMLEGAKNPNSIRSFHNENLIPSLREHRKVLEVLGSKTMIKSLGKQLSGVGFNSTVRDSVILKLKGNFQRTIKVIF